MGKTLALMQNCLSRADATAWSAKRRKISIKETFVRTYVPRYGQYQTSKILD